MANIMITNLCNLNCSYCFANDYVNKHNIAHIQLSMFKRALDFALSGKSPERIGLIGGEPTLHPEFDSILKILNENNEVKDVLLFTNGLRLNQFADALQNPKFQILVNVNDPAIIGKYQFSKICNNIKLLVNKKNMSNRLAPGLNIYDSNLSYDYIFDLIDEVGLSELRISIIVPNSVSSEFYDPLSYYKEMKPITLSVIKRCLKRNIKPYFDCNRLPLCLLDEDEYDELITLLSGKSATNILEDRINCTPVIDIFQDLTAVRCFGLSDYLRINTEDFSSIDDLRGFFENEIDDYSHKVINNPQCRECYERNCKKCMGGCLAYKINQIHTLSEHINQMMEKVI